MTPTASLVLSILLATSAAVAVTFTLRSPEPPAAPTGLTDVQRELADLRAQNQKLQQRLEALAAAAPVAAPPAPTERSAAPVVSPEQIAAAVEAFLKRNGAAGANLAAGGTATGEPGFDLDVEFKKLGTVSYDDDPELWKRLHAAGKAKEALERFEALVKANPTDTAAHMQLANANLAYMRVVPSEYNLAIRADKAFDDVLALDEKHWEARFTKAVSYSFWPPLTGKPKQAIGHLETLVGQQESMPAQAHEANTYLILGNLLEQGDSARAKEIWQKGARRHPDNQELAQKAK